MDSSQRALIAEYDQMLSASSPSPQGASEPPLSEPSQTPETLPSPALGEEIVGVEAAAADEEEATPRTEVPYPSTYQAGGANSSLRSSGLDGDNLSLILDDGLNKVKRDVMEFFLSAKGKLMEHEASAVERERREWMRIIRAKQDEIDALMDTNARKDTQIKRLAVQLMRAAEFRANSMTRAEALRISLASMASWKIYVQRSRELKHRLKLWMVHNTKTYVMGSVFKAWRSAVHHELHVNLNARLAAALDAERAKVTAEQASAMNRLNAEIDELNFRLQKEQESRKSLEEQMKKAFMRGVCALNLEAMNLMKSGHPPGGVNPFGSELSEGDENADPVEESPVYHRAAMMPTDFLGSGGPAEALMERQQLQQQVLREAAVKEAASAVTAPPEQSSASAALERFLAQVNRASR